MSVVKVLSCVGSYVRHSGAIYNVAVIHIDR